MDVAGPSGRAFQWFACAFPAFGLTSVFRKLHVALEGPSMPDPRSLFQGKRITVMGLGLLGRGLGDTIFLIKCGARVTVTDLKSAQELAPSLSKLQGLPCRLKLGGHEPDDFVHADMILRNADVPRSSRFLKIAAENRVPVTVHLRYSL